MPTPTPAHRAAPSALLSVTTGTCTGVASTSAMICGQRLPLAAPPVKTVLPGGDDPTGPPRAPIRSGRPPAGRRRWPPPPPPLPPDPPRPPPAAPSPSTAPPPRP